MRLHGSPVQILTLVLAALLAWPWDSMLAALSHPPESAVQSAPTIRPRRESSKPRRVRAETHPACFDFDDFIDSDGDSDDAWRLDRTRAVALPLGDMARRIESPLTARSVLLRTWAEPVPLPRLRC